MTGADSMLGDYVCTLPMHGQAAEDDTFAWDSAGAAVVSHPAEFTVAFRQELGEALALLGPKAPAPVLMRLVSAFALLRSARAAARGTPVALSSTLPSPAHPVYPLAREAMRKLDATPGGTDVPMSAAVAHLLQCMGPGAFTTITADEAAKEIDGLTGVHGNLDPQHRSLPTRMGSELDPLRHGLATFDPESLTRWVRTGLTQFPLPLDGLDLSPEPTATSVGPRELEGVLDAWEAAGDQDGLASVSQRLRAAVRLPRPEPTPADLDHGGLGDITNRGTPERLLLSELAHDDEVLVARIVLGEALYSERAAEPLANFPGRRVIIDAGIRTWGRARIYVNAAALALGCGATGPQQTTFFRAGVTSLEPADLGSEAGLLEHLGVQNATTHPGAALACLGGTTSDQDVLITTHRALADPAFQALLVAHTGRGNAITLVAVDGDGHIKTLRADDNGARLLRAAHVPHEDPGAARTATSVASPVTEGRMPAIVQFSPLPLRVGVPIERARAVVVRGKTLVLTRDRRLVLFESNGPDRPTTDVATELAVLPWGDCVAFGKHGSGIIVAIWSAQTEQLVIALGDGGRPPQAHVYRVGSRPRLSAVAGQIRVDTDEGHFHAKGPKLLRVPVDPSAAPLDVTRTETEALSAIRPLAQLTRMDGATIERSTDGAPMALILQRRTSAWRIPLEGDFVIQPTAEQAGEEAERRGPRYGFSRDGTAAGAMARFLTLAQLPAGVALWHDRRGLLHVQPSERGLGELTLALRHAGPISWWHAHPGARGVSDTRSGGPHALETRADAGAGFRVQGWLRAVLASALKGESA